MFISQAIAQTAETAAEVSPTTGIISQLAVVVLIVYFILIRPQQKRIKKHEAALNAIIKGTQIVVGGMLGKVTGIIDDKKLIVEFAPGIEFTVMRDYVSQVLFETPENTPKKKRKEK